MAGENVEVVRRIIATWEQGDFSSAEWAHPEIEWVIVDGLSPGTWSGHTGLTEGERDFLHGWEEYRLDVDGYRELDADRVLVLVRSRGRGRTSGLELGEIGQKGAAVFHIRDGKVMRLLTYYDRERALVDLGLPSDVDASQ